MVVAFVEHHGLILLRPAHELLAGTLAVALNENVELLALVFSVLLGAYFGLQLYQFIESLYLHLLRHVVGQMF